MQRFEKARKNPETFMDWDEAKKYFESLMKKFRVKIEPEALADIQEIINDSNNTVEEKFCTII